MKYSVRRMVKGGGKGKKNELGRGNALYANDRYEARRGVERK
jgi:hypothetical protein